MFNVKCTTWIPFQRPRLVVDADRVEFQGKSWLLADVEHVWWYAQTIVDSGILHDCEAGMKLFFRSEPKPVVCRQNKAMALSDSSTLVPAWRYISERTRAQRLAKYVDALATKGAFEYCGVTFHADGTARRGNREFSLQGVRLDEFSLRVPGKLTSLVDVRLDHDVFPALVEHLAATAQRPAATTGSR
ncbi:MAG: hypothetical protein IPK26_17850 [Planctomycetes bacterium]|nr:hypothetical protein [Planctomycetota bacterium]